MKNKIKGDLSISGINKIISRLEEYKQDLLRRTEKFCEELSDVGINTARGLIGNEYNGYIALVKEVNPTQYGCSAILIMKDESPIISEWYGEDEVKKTAEVSATLMVEFGSGKKANATPQHIKAVNAKEKVGRGTFPSENTKPFGNENHANQNVWWWKDLDGKWKHSSGLTPTMPLYNAYVEMEREIKQIWRKNFR